MSANLCEHCTATCCHYIALPIEKPETAGELDDVRWYLIHDGVSVFVEDGEWYILFRTTCRHLLPHHRCGMYATRPRICRKYTTDDCDYHSGDYHWQHHFTCPEHLDEYVRTLGRTNGKRVSAARPPRRRLALPRSPGRPARSATPDAQCDRHGVWLPTVPASRSGR